MEEGTRTYTVVRKLLVSYPVVAQPLHRRGVSAACVNHTAQGKHRPKFYP